MKISLRIVLLAVGFPAIALAASGQDQESENECGCLEYPFTPDPPCWDVCVVKVISRTPTEKLSNVLGLGPELQSQIMKFEMEVPTYTTASQKSVMFKDFFSDFDQTELRSSFENADQEQLFELMKDASGG